MTAHKDTAPLTAVFPPPTSLYEWLIMPQGSCASPVWFAKATQEVTKGLQQVAAYLDGVILFDSDPPPHVKTIRALFERVYKHNLSKARLGATDADFLGDSISPAGVRLNAEKSVGFYSHAPRSGTAAFSPGWPFLLPKVPAR